MRLHALLTGGVSALALLARAFPVLAWPSPHTLGPYAYISPAPGSGLHMPGTSIIVRPGGAVDPSSIRGAVVHAVGSVSGNHEGSLRLSDDGETIVFHPRLSFALGESVACTIDAGIATAEAGSLPEASFWFRTSNTAPPDPGPGRGLGLYAAELGATGTSSTTPAPARAPPPLRSPTKTFPLDFPAVLATPGEGAGEGSLFLSSVQFGEAVYGSYLMILDNEGEPIFYRKIPGIAFDFKLQPTGVLTYFDDAADKFYALNTDYAVVDSFAVGDGYSTDLHDLQLLPDGHALLMAYDSQSVDMSAVVVGGNPSATVTGLVVQELDLSRDVVFEWRSWDHFQITDALGVDLTAPVIDYAHGNAIEKDADGNLLLSCRHMDEITKIDREDGHILWRWGGKNNEFAFPNDPDHFSHQHSIRRLPDGHVILFDNGNLHTPSYSRAAEYTLDESAKIAMLVWQYRTDPDTYGLAMGSVERLANGNTVIGWGATTPALIEVTPDGHVAQELRLPSGVFSYRAFRFAWPPTIAQAVNEKPVPARMASPVGAYPLRIDFRGGSAPPRTVTMSAYDVRGRRVRRWTATIDAAGEATWDGRGQNGERLASGIYFVGIEKAPIAEMAKVVLVK